MLEQRGTAVSQERNSRKTPLSDEDARALLKGVSTVLVAKGKKVREVVAAEADLGDLKGPTGNYRAPMIQVGRKLLVGFHPETLESLLDG